MVTVIEGNNDWEQAARQFASSLGQSYMDRTDENSIREALGSLKENASPRDILNAVTGAKTYNPASKQKAFENYLGVDKFQELKRQSQQQESIAEAKNEIAKSKMTNDENKETLERKQTKEIVNQLDIPSDKKDALGNSLSLSTAEDLLKEQLKPVKDEKFTPFNKKLQEHYSDEYINLTKEIPKLEDTLDTINYARKVSDEIGYVGQGLSALGLSEKGTHLESVTFPLIEPILKMLAPSGAIAKEKLIRSEQKYAIKGSDAPWNRKAKLDALERFTKQAVNRAKKRLELIKNNNFNPNKNEVEKFDKESETIIDAMIDYDLLDEEVDSKGFPDVKKFKDKTVTSPEGQKYYSDGTRWVKR